MQQSEDPRMKRFGNSTGQRSGGDRIRLSGIPRDDAAAWADALARYPQDHDLHAGFEQWRAASTRHAEAFASVDKSYALARSAGSSEPLMALRNRTLLRVSAHSRRRNHRLAALAAGAAATLVIATGAFWLSGGSWQQLQQLQENALHAFNGDAVYRTAPGERLAVTLQDGTQLTLNTDSHAVVQYRDAVRGVRLVRGQALFEVARDPAHPFVVSAGGRKVTALGTAFDVQVSQEGLSVTLIEGRVSVEPDQTRPMAAIGGGSAVRAELGPGEQLVVATAVPTPVIRKTDTRRAISWRDGQVIFRDDPLVQAVREINRYGARRIELAGNSLDDLRISGAFNTGNTAGFVATLTSYFDVRVVESDAERIVLAPR